MSTEKTREERSYPRYQDVDGFVVPEAFSVKVFRDALKYKPEVGDLFVATFPKCGTTWTQVIIYLLYHDGQPASNVMSLFATSPFLEMIGRESVENRVKPGAIKVHLPYHLTPYSDEAKYIFVVRNPKDSCVSFFHHTRLHGYCFENGSFDTYFDIFVDGKNDFGDYFDTVLGWYEHRNDPNVLMIYYEHMKKDIKSQIQKMADFIDPNIGERLREDDDFMDRCVQYSSLSYMKEHINPAFNDPWLSVGGRDVDISRLPLPEGWKYFLQFMKDNPYDLDKSSIESDDRNFIRKGNVGDWRNMFTPEQNERMNQKIEDKLKGTELLEVWREEGCLD